MTRPNRLHLEAHSMSFWSDEFIRPQSVTASGWTAYAAAMVMNRRLQLIGLLTANIAAQCRGLRLPYKFAVGASVLVVCGMAHLGIIVTGHIKDSTVQQSAAAAALYMDSFVERHVQELATKSTLSEENRQALDRLLSPAAMHRPIIAFRIWKGDTIAFSNERELIGKTFAQTASRARAMHGQMAVEFEQPDGDDDEQVRSLKLPVLEVYAPVHETGTARIIALTETYEVALDLKNEVRINQRAAWAVIAAIALSIVLLLFSMANTDRIERSFLLGRIGDLSRLQAESDRGRQRIRDANLHVSAMNENSLRSVGNELHDGPAQYVALALLKFESLESLVVKANRAMPLHTAEHQEDLEAIRRALNDTLRHIRGIARNFLPPDIEDLSVAEMFARAARHHERRTGMAITFETDGLPEQLPFSLKACLYRLALESLNSTSGGEGARVQIMRVCIRDDCIVLEIIGVRRMDEHSELSDLRDRIEALGGTLGVHSISAARLSLVVELNLSEMG